MENLQLATGFDFLLVDDSSLLQFSNAGSASDNIVMQDGSNVLLQDASVVQLNVGAGVDNILLQDDSHLLQEDGDSVIILEAEAAGGTYTGSGTPSAGAATASGSGTHTAPVFTGSATPSIGAATASGSGTHTVPTGSGTPSIGAVTASGTGTNVDPVWSGGATPITGAATASGSGTFVPTFTGSAALTIGAVNDPVTLGTIGTGLFSGGSITSGTIIATAAAIAAGASGTFVRLQPGNPFLRRAPVLATGHRRRAVQRDSGQQRGNPHREEVEPPQ